MSVLVAIGECMAEVAPADGGLHRLGFAGDTFNAAWTSRHLLRAPHVVRYATVIGTDWVSDEMLAVMRAGGLDLSAVRRDPVRSVGLYAIRLVAGERSFAYWRAGSAATTLADDGPALEAAVADASAVLVSGITLAILAPERRATLVAVLAAARERGVRIAFDPNYRARLWQDAADARVAFDAFARIADCVLPSFSDEAELFDDASAAGTARRLAALGVTEIVVKDGPGPALCVHDGESVWVAPPDRVAPLDSTGAGDAFNGAYLAARLSGAAPVAATRLGHLVAAVAIRTRGALIASDDPIFRQGISA